MSKICFSVSHALVAAFVIWSRLSRIVMLSPHVLKQLLLPCSLYPSRCRWLERSRNCSMNRALQIILHDRLITYFIAILHFPGAIFFPNFITFFFQPLCHSQTILSFAIAKKMREKSIDNTHSSSLLCTRPFTLNLRRRSSPERKRLSRRELLVFGTECGRWQSGRAHHLLIFRGMQKERAASHLAFIYPRQTMCPIEFSCYLPTIGHLDCLSKFQLFSPFSKHSILLGKTARQKNIN